MSDKKQEQIKNVKKQNKLNQYNNENPKRQICYLIKNLYFDFYT